jgi:hypothetical protein
MKQGCRRVVVWAIAGALGAIATGGEARAQSEPRFTAIVEGSAIWSSRNDVRIPPDTGTEVSIVDLIGSGPTGAVRVEAAFQAAERHGLKFVYAPLSVTGRGTPSGPISFAGTTFATTPTEAEYQFHSYRATYRYRVFDGDTWRWDVGFTGFVRDARVALRQTGAAAEDANVGFVPLGHIRGEARLKERWRLATELDGAAAPQGRAFDFSATLDYQPAPRWMMGIGYRTIEGGADVDEVFTFAWLNATVVRVGLRF